MISKFRKNFKQIYFKYKKYQKSFIQVIKSSKNNLLRNQLNLTSNFIHTFLIKYKFFFNFSDCFFFFKNNFLFLNKKKIICFNQNLKFGDFIEFIFIKNYIFFLLKNITYITKIKNINFFKKKINFKTKKLVNNYFLKKLKVNFYSKNKSNVLFEIDFLTLSLFYLNKNINIFNLELKDKKFINLFYFNFLK